MANKGQIYNLRPVSVDGVLVRGAVEAAKLLGVNQQTIHKAIKYGYKCKGCMVERVEKSQQLSRLA